MAKEMAGWMRLRRGKRYEQKQKEQETGENIYFQVFIS